jgi:hypothetical protein
MARKVYVSSDMSNDERLIEITEKDYIAALIWPWLLTGLDDWGRAEASPRRIKAHLFPMFDSIKLDTIEKALDLLAEYGLIESYGDPKKPYMAVAPEKWFKYQTHIRAEKRTKDGSKLPPQPGWNEWVLHEKSQVVRGATTSRGASQSKLDDNDDEDALYDDIEDSDTHNDGLALFGHLLQVMDVNDTRVYDSIEAVKVDGETFRVLIRPGVDEAWAQSDLVATLKDGLRTIGRGSMEVECVNKKPANYRTSASGEAFCKWISSMT